jgi:hypothetical protein
MRVLELTKENVDILLETKNIGVLEDTGIRLKMLSGGMYEVYEGGLSFEVVVLYRTHQKGERLYLLQTERALAPQEEAFVVQSVDVPLVLPYGELLDFLLSKVSEGRVYWIFFLKGLEKLDLYTGLDLWDSKKFKKRLRQKLKMMYPNKRMDDGFIFNPQEFMEIIQFALNGAVKN